MNRQTMLPADQKYYDEFVAAIKEVMPAYQHISFNYLAIKKACGFIIIQARIFLGTAPTEAPATHFLSNNIRAGKYLLSELRSDLSSLIKQLLTGKVQTPGGVLYFPTSPGGLYGASFVSFHPEGLSVQSRYNVLKIMGGEIERIQQPDMDWEIKAASPPYDSLQELAAEYHLLPPSTAPSYVEIIGFNVANVDANKSVIKGTKAEIYVLLANGLNPEKVTLGYRLLSQGKILRRAVVEGKKMTWTKEDKFQSGYITLQIPNAAVIHCTSSYSGIAQAFYWLNDPATNQSARRAAYETFDPKLEFLQNIISGAQSRKQARELEAAVAWLLWMLGFSPAHLGITKLTQEAADLIVTTSSGNFIVIECTTGILGADKKIPLLHDRCEAVRRNLASSNLSHLRILPVLITSKYLNDVRAELEDAEKLGIRVLTRENLDNLITRTMLQTNPDQLYEEAEKAVRSALMKYEALAATNSGIDLSG